MRAWTLCALCALLLAACNPSPVAPATVAPTAVPPQATATAAPPVTATAPAATRPPEASATPQPPATATVAPSPAPTQAPPSPTPAGELFVREAGETLDVFARRIIPDGMQLAHPALEGDFGPGAGNIVMLFGETVPGPYAGWVLVPEGEAYRQYDLPASAHLWSWAEWEVQAVTFALVDTDARPELLVLSDFASGSGPHATRVRYTWVYRWRAGEFQYLAEVTDALGSAFPARAVFERLSELGYGPLEGTPAAGELRLGENLGLTYTAYTETGTVPYTYTLTTRTPVLEGSDDVRVARVNRAILALVQYEVTGFKDGLADLPVGAPFAGTYLDVNGSLESPPGTVASIKLYFHGYTGGAHPYHYARTVNYDLATGRMLLLDDLFQPGADYLPVISDYCREELLSREISLFEEGLVPVPDNFTHWSLVAEGLQITFNEYDVAAYVFGPQIVVVPYELLQGMLVDTYPR